MFLLSHCGPKFTERVGPITGAGGWPITGAGGWPLGNDARHVYNFTCANCISNSNMPRNLLKSLRRYERRLSGNQAPLQHASLQLYIGCLLSCSSVYCMDLIGQLLRFGGQRIRTFLSVLTLLLYIFTKISVSIFFIKKDILLSSTVIRSNIIRAGHAKNAVLRSRWGRNYLRPGAGAEAEVIFF